MYQILIDGRDLYYPRDEEYTVSDAVVHLQLNDSGSVEFGLPALNPEYGNIKNRISMLQVLKNGKEIFYGEVRESEKDFYGTEQVTQLVNLLFCLIPYSHRRNTGRDSKAVTGDVAKHPQQPSGREKAVLRWNGNGS